MPFETATRDFDFVKEQNIRPDIIKKDGKINVVYIGAINKFFHPLIKSFFIAFSEEVKEKEQYHFYFIGTNYAKGISQKSIEKMAATVKMKHLVTEVPDRISYFTALATLMEADILFIPGLTNSEYNASKIYNNIYAGTPILSIFNENSQVKKVMEETGAGIFVGVNEKDSVEEMVAKIKLILPAFRLMHLQPNRNTQHNIQDFLAPAMVKKQVHFFNQVIARQPLAEKLAVVNQVKHNAVWMLPLITQYII